MEIMTKSLRDGRRNWAIRFYIAGETNIMLGLLHTCIEEDDEVCGVYGPQCWQGYHVDRGGFKKMMRYSIMKESAALSLPGRGVTTGKKWPSRAGSEVRTGRHRSWSACWVRGQTQVSHAFTMRSMCAVRGKTIQCIP